MNLPPAALAVTLLCFLLPCAAQDMQPPALASATPQRAAPPAPDDAASAPSNEPNVRHIVVEDGGSRIDELRVRGTTQRVVVTPKVGTTKSYEIIMGDGSRNLTDAANTSRGAAGKRVWNVLSF